MKRILWISTFAVVLWVENGLGRGDELTQVGVKNDLSVAVHPNIVSLKKFKVENFFGYFSREKETTPIPSQKYSDSLSIEEIESSLASREVTSIEDFLEKLPSSYRGNYMLMRKSKSRHRSATVVHPRMILFGNDASLLVGIATNPEDKNFNDLEVIQLRNDGSWDFRVAKMNAGNPTLGAKANKKCQHCHGNPARPIWGAYPTWEGAYLEQNPGVVELSSDELSVLEEAVEFPKRYPRLSKLDLRIRGNYLNETPERFSEHLPVLLNMDLGSRLAESLHHRLAQESNFDAWKHQLLFLENCGEYYDNDRKWHREFHPSYSEVRKQIDEFYLESPQPNEHVIKAYYKGGYRNRLYWALGFDPRVEFGISSRIFDVSWDHKDLNSQDWFEGEATLGQKTAFLVLGDLFASDGGFAKSIPEAFRKRYQDLHFYTFPHRGLGRIQDFNFMKIRKNRYYYMYFSRFFDSLRHESRFCDLLSERILK